MFQSFKLANAPYQTRASLVLYLHLTFARDFLYNSLVKAFENSIQKILAHFHNTHNISTLCYLAQIGISKLRKLPQN